MKDEKDVENGELHAENRRLRAENERLRDVLLNISTKAREVTYSMPSYEYPYAVEEIDELARAALGNVREG